MNTNSNNTTIETDTVRHLRNGVEGAAAELVTIETTGEFPADTWTEDGETPTIHDWLDSFLVVETATNQRGHFYGAVLSVTLGGPNIWIEFDKSETATVHGAWGDDRHTVTVYVPDLYAEIVDLTEEQHAAR
jgi:hypothetical protein